MFDGEIYIWVLGTAGRIGTRDGVCALQAGSVLLLGTIDLFRLEYDRTNGVASTMRRGCTGLFAPGEFGLFRFTASEHQLGNIAAARAFHKNAEVTLVDCSNQDMGNGIILAIQ